MIIRIAVAAIAATAVQQGIGYFWYSSVAFFTPWAAAYDIPPETFTGPAPAAIAAAIASALVFSFFIYWLIRKTGTKTLVDGCIIGVFTAAFAIVPSIVMHNTFGRIGIEATLIDSTRMMLNGFFTGAIMTLPVRN